MGGVDELPLPAIGAALIWVPAAIYLTLFGAWFKASILVAIGILAIGLVDNFLRPPLVGKETKLPDYLVLISTIGGISLIGLNGFVIGPLVAALFLLPPGEYSYTNRMCDGVIAISSVGPSCPQIRSLAQIALEQFVNDQHPMKMAAVTGNPHATA